MNYLIGTRGSKLSISQTNWVMDELKKANPECDYKITPITTKGDVDSRPLFTIDQKGIFEKEVDRAVAESEVDFAVHSLKDVPSDLPEGLVLACIPKRESVNDVLITKNGFNLDELPKNSVVGTSSLRRAVQISRKRPDLKVKPIRGNIETRINKIGDGSFDAIVLALAGISRLGLDTKYSILSTDDFSPSPGQGALAIVARKGDMDTIKMLQKIQDTDSRNEIEAERELSNVVESGCRFPVGAYAKSNGDEMNLTVHAFSVDGAESITVTKTGKKDNPISLGKQAADELLEKGVNDLALNWREKVEEWNT